MVENIPSTVNLEIQGLTPVMTPVMQTEAMAAVLALEKDLCILNDPALTHAWAKLQTSNHFHWMSTKGGADGALASPLIPYPSAREAHQRFMTVLEHLASHVREQLARRKN